MTDKMSSKQYERLNFDTYQKEEIIKQINNHKKKQRENADTSNL